MFLHKAMRYYRLWIYACNAVLLASVVVILVYAVLIAADYRLQFVPYIKFYYPTFLYAYVAVLVQGGVIQAVGCYAALKLNERLLNLYWVLLLVLLVGDLITGVVWIFRYDRIYHEMLPLLRKQLETTYGSDPEFTKTWDRLQVESKCCGIAGPLDYNKTSLFTGTASSLNVPATCCHPSQALPIQLTYNAAMSSIGSANGSGGLNGTIPGGRSQNFQHSSTFSVEHQGDSAFNERWKEIEINEDVPVADIEVEATIGRRRDGNRTPRSTHRHRHWQQSLPAKQVSKPGQPPGTAQWGFGNRPDPKKQTPEYNFTCLDAHLAPNMEANLAGCGPVLMHWLGEAAEALFVLGFCVIAFSKICFLGLLRYEIKEMIQKIKILHCEEAEASAEGARQSEFAEIAAAFGAATGTGATSNHVQQQSVIANPAAVQDQVTANAVTTAAQPPSQDLRLKANLSCELDTFSEGPTPVHLRLNHLNPNYDSMSENSNSAALLLPNDAKKTHATSGRELPFALQAAGTEESHEMNELLNVTSRQTEI